MSVGFFHPLLGRQLLGPPVARVSGLDQVLSGAGPKRCISQVSNFFLSVPDLKVRVPASNSAALCPLFEADGQGVDANPVYVVCLLPAQLSHT